MGWLDDWSYARSAQVFAATGHIVYNGWATAMLGWQIAWGAVFIRLFGFSFTVLRMGMLPFAVGAVALLHSCLRRFGVRPWNAVLGCLTFGLSPIVVPFIPTYMTDISGVFLLLLCLYLCLRAVQASGRRAVLFWLSAAAVTNIVGGSARQIVWLGVLVMVPATGWLLRKQRHVLGVSLGLWAVGLVSVLAIMRWFAAQPYSIPELVPKAGLHATAAFVLHMADIVPCMLLLVTPLLVAWLPQAKFLGRAAWLRVGVGLGTWAAGSLLLIHSNLRTSLIMPWMRLVLYNMGMDAYDVTLPGVRPVTLGMRSRVLIGALVLMLGLIAFECARRQMRSNSVPRTVRPGLDWRTLGWTVGPFAFAYLVLLMPRALESMLFDRYLIGLLPFAILALLKLYEDQSGERLPVACTIALAVFSVYTLAATHDWFALDRARVAIAEELEANGVPLTQIQGGWEFDGWTQIKDGGYINDSRLVTPRGAYQAHRSVTDACVPGFTGWTPAIHPRYVIAHSFLGCLGPVVFPPVPYQTWLPPFSHELIAQSVFNTAQKGR